MTDRKTLIDDVRRVLGPEASELLERWDDASLEPEGWSVAELEELEREVLAQVASWTLAGDAIRLGAFARGMIALAQLPLQADA